MTTPAEPLTKLNISDIVRGPIPPRVVNATWPNKLHTRIGDVVAQMGAPPWSVRLLQDERNLVTLIANGPGTGNRPHWHKDFDEWWVILAGELQWELTGGTVIRAAKDDLVWVPRGTVHHIQNVGSELSLRMAIAMPPAVHYYEPCQQCGYADDGPRAFW
ncbi:MAG TPA: cupin domain-containing protein [Chloroflexota bacterium]|jgi:mannose-6-phosphate isomerase-like protein (cupin superfamily)|nr:cupin domain-containing protein [Chloroflexota bacterium]